MTDTSCGLTRHFRPKWLQRFATPRTYMVVYGLLGTIQAMSFVYFTVTLSNIEKRFKISSKTTGMMLSGNEVSQILLSLFLTYVGGQKNRPLWVAWGVACSAVSCFIIILPHVLYGAGKDALALTHEYMDESKFHNYTEKDSLELCSNTTAQTCKQYTTSDFSAVPTVTIFISQFILGIGTTLYFSLGQTYIDDNTEKTKTPMVLAITLALRTIGPVFGFLIGFICNRMYVDPTLTPQISEKDPRWIGAWWLGWILLGVAQFLFAFILAMFPKTMPRKNKGQLEDNLMVAINGMNTMTKTKELVGDQKGEKTQLSGPSKTVELSFQDFLKAFKRIVTNKILIVNTWSGILYIIGASGFITYMVKYLEVQFQKSAAESSKVTGPMAILAMCLGYLSAGFVISKYKPKAFNLLMWNVIGGITFVAGQMIILNLSCSEQPLVGYNPVLNRVDLTSNCNRECGCMNLKYSPVCHQRSDQTFYSACHAGCTKSFKSANSQPEYGNCSCPFAMTTGERFNNENFKNELTDNGPSAHTWTKFQYKTDRDNFSQDTLKSGPCPADCGYNFVAFLAVTSVMHFITSSGKIGNILINYRAVSVEDKTFSQGLSLLMLSLFAFIPGPILFGHIIDTTCIIWDESCGGKGNCWLYNKDEFRRKLNLTAIVFIAGGTILDAWVCYLGKDIDLYGEKDSAHPVENNTEKLEEKSES